VIGMSNLRIGVPSKGRLSELAAELLKQAGLSFRRQERSLFARVGEMPIDITFLRTDDIPVLCAEGAIDMGITGNDLVAEAGADVLTRLELGMGRCKLALCVPDDSPITTPAQLAGKRVATSFPNVTRRYLQEHKADVHLVNLGGSVEIMITLGVADAIVDLVETGSTLAANRLRVLADIGKYESILIQNKARRESELADRVVRRLEGVVIARSWSLLEYNLPRAKLAEAEKITPGFNSPTVNAMEDPAWCAVRVMVQRGEVIGVMEQLEALGAHAILETQINNCRL
jgi:ATP phosphoribosyltransferase